MCCLPFGVAWVDSVKKTLNIIGSTGSIGRQAIEVAQAEGIRITAMSAHSNGKLFEEQIRLLRPELVCMSDETAARDLRTRLADLDVTVRSGEEGLIETAIYHRADTVLTAVVGMVGLRPTLAAAQRGMRIALANKETLVCAGGLVNRAVADGGAELLPVDSEHSAIFQSLQGNDRRQLKKLILTASGGPFFGKTAAELAGVTVEDALKHPNWNMGRKITIDSATMMNKGLEFIEAMHLFGVTPDQIEVLIHRESIIHSLVEYADNSVIAQLGMPDMRLPIQYALCYPKRGGPIAPPLDLAAVGSLHFDRPDLENFPCLVLAMQAAQTSGVSGAVLNGANELAVQRFLDKEISFTDIGTLVQKAMEAAPHIDTPTLEDVFEADRFAREFVRGGKASS